MRYNRCRSCNKMYRSGGLYSSGLGLVCIFCLNYSRSSKSSPSPSPPPSPTPSSTQSPPTQSPPTQSPPPNHPNKN